jgi:hypothetical protein
MNAHRIWTLTILAAALMAVLTPGAQAQMLDQRARVTFSGPVEIPGMVLPAGTYVFEALQPGHLTRVLSADATHIYGTLFTVPEERRDPVEKATIVLEENVKGAPERIEGWFYPGYSTGNEFIYQKAGTHRTLAAVLGAAAKDTERAGIDAARAAAISSEFVGRRAEHIAVNTGLAIAHAAKYLVS